MNVRLLSLLVIAPAVVACAPEASGVAGAAGQARLLVPTDVEFPWNAAYNVPGDGLAAVLPLDVMVYDDAGEPVVGVDVELASDVATFVDADSVLAGSPDCDGCLWDAYRDEFLDLSADAGAEPLSVTSDGDGLVRAYAVVDALRDGGSGFEPATVRVRLGAEEQALRLEPR